MNEVLPNILALDLGTKCGYAYNTGELFCSGTWVLAAPKEIREWGKSRLTRRDDPRVTRLCEKVSGLPEFDVLSFEDVQFSSYTLATQLWSALRSAAWLCVKRKHTECVPVKTLKLFATGAGNSTKDAMERALRRTSYWKVGISEDTVDAVWVWLWSQKNLNRMKI